MQVPLNLEFIIEGSQVSGGGNDHIGGFQVAGDCNPGSFTFRKFYNEGQAPELFFEGRMNGPRMLQGSWGFQPGQMTGEMYQLNMVN